MIFCAPISSLELGEEVGAFFVSVPTSIFPCPRKNSCVGREKKYPGREGKLKEYFGGNGSVIQKGCVI